MFSTSTASRPPLRAAATMSAPQTTHTLSIVDQSPVFQFSPYMSNSTDDGWKVFYQDSPDSSYDLTHTANNLGHGQSHHASTSSGASATIEFYGSACTLYGVADAGTYKTRLDDGDEQDGSPSGSNTLAAYSGLDYGKHTLVRLRPIRTEGLADCDHKDPHRVRRQASRNPVRGCRVGSWRK